MRVFWTRTAKDQLDAIYNYIALDSEYYAKHVVDRITQRSLQIARFPLSGRRVPEYAADNLREVIEASYRIIYLIKSNQIDIVTVLHGARDVREL